MSKPAHIAILGGGLAGLAAGHYAKKNRLRFTIYEAHNQVGGNCITLKHGDFLFDSGAHRFHDKEEEATRELRKLIGEDLEKTNVPSQIYYNGKLIDFPLSPLNLLKNLGLSTFARAVVEVVRSRLRKREMSEDFESFALHTYGSTIAKLFLLNYSKKLWGVPCHKLSPNAAAKRMKGLNLKTFLTEAIFGQKAKAQHLEGSFYYPRMGIGTIAEKPGEYCGQQNILPNSKITKILHNHTRIQAVEVNGRKRIDVDKVVSTLPLTIFLQMMEPVPSEEVLLLAKGLRYRHLILVAIFLNKESITEAATVYFPDSNFPFTRIYEPRNRSVYMSPPGKTSLVAEIPNQEEDMFWHTEDGKLIELVCSRLIQIGWVKEEEIIDTFVGRMDYAYPMLEIGCEEKVQKINAFLKGFNNLKLSGRNGKFIHASIHEMIKFGKEIIQEYISARGK